MESVGSLIEDGKVYNVNLGDTFKKRCHTAFTTIKLDFKPASVDVTQPGRVDVKDKQVEIVLPHQVNSKNSKTVYKGSAKPASKECVLIIDPATGSLTLERINSVITAKKIRLAPDQKSVPATLTLPPQQPPQLPHKVPSAMKHSNFLPTPSSLPPQKPQQVKQVPLKSSITLQSRKQQDDDIQLPFFGLPNVEGNKHIADDVKDEGEMSQKEIIGMLNDPNNLSSGDESSGSSSSSGSSGSEDERENESSSSTPMVIVPAVVDDEVNSPHSMEDLDKNRAENTDLLDNDLHLSDSDSDSDAD